MWGCLAVHRDSSLALKARFCNTQALFTMFTHTGAMLTMLPHLPAAHLLEAAKQRLGGHAVKGVPRGHRAVNFYQASC